MTPSEFDQFRRDLRDAGISLWIEAGEDGGDVLVAWPSHSLTTNQIETLKASKPDIIRWHRRRILDLLPSTEVCDLWRARYCHQPRRVCDE